MKKNLLVIISLFFLAGCTNTAINIDDGIIRTEDGTAYGVQNPLSTDGDQVYFKDLDVGLSDPGNFVIPTNPNATKEDILMSMVSDLYVTKIDTTTNNPKIVTLAFNRPVLTNSLGIDSSLVGNFSNVKIYIAQGQMEFLAFDGSTDNEKKLIEIFAINPLKFSSVRFEFHTADPVSTGMYGIFKNQEVASRIQAIGDLTGNVEDVTSYRGTLNVNSAFVHRKIVNQYYHMHTGNEFNLTSPVLSGDISINVISTIGLVVGDEIKIEEGLFEEIAIPVVTALTATTITLDKPVGNTYTTSAMVSEVNTNMAVSGTLANPVIFELDPTEDTVWQITRILIAITDNLAADDSKFGGISSLTNGVTLRAVTAANRTAVFGNWKNNGDLKLDMFDVIYSDKAGAGTFGVNGKWTFTTSEIVAELDGNDPTQQLQILIQDDLTGLINFRVKGQGRVFSP